MDGFVRGETDVAVFVVVHRDGDGAGDGVGGGREEVGGAPPAVPEIAGRVFVRDEEEG